MPCTNLQVIACQVGLCVQEKDDCTHWCHPSGYQVWVAQLHALLKQELHNLPPPPSLPMPQRTQSLHAAVSATRTKHRVQAND